MSRRPTSAGGLVVLPHRRFGRIDLAGAGTGTGTLGRLPRSGPAARVAAAAVAGGVARRTDFVGDRGGGPGAAVRGDRFHHSPAHHGGRLGGRRLGAEPTAVVSG